jgi:HlyD family secretion protein
MPEIISKNGAHVEIADRVRDSITHRSEVMMDIVSNKPGFLIRWGNLFFLLILTFLGVACWFIRYPDTIAASAKLTSINAPKPVVTLVGGKLVKLFISENQLVHKRQIIGYVESTARHDEILRILVTVDSIQMLLDADSASWVRKYFSSNHSLFGELQLSYQAYSQAFLLYNNFLADGFYEKKRGMLAKDKTNLEKLLTNLKEQQKLQEQDLALAQKTFDANQLLKKDNVISDFDYRIEQSKLINKKLSLPQIRSSIIANESQQADKEKEMMELENTMNQQKLIFQQALNTFRSQVEEWKKRYIMEAPIAGKVAFASFIQENQQLSANQTICYINPENSQYFAEIVIPQANFGKVSVGQAVLLRFESYPFQEFGSVMGKIEFISHIPSEKGYQAKVILTNGLVTTYKKQVQYRDGLLANAEIVTRDMRLLERFYYNFVRQIKK